MGLSQAQIVANLSAEEQAEVLAGIDPDELLWDAQFWLRPEQQAPAGEWSVWLASAGRGFGKTYLGAQWIRECARQTSLGKINIGLVARTAADARDVIVEGASGIMAVHPPSEMPLYEPSKRRLTWPNGNTATVFSADEPAALRGPQFHYAWGDELAAWRRMPDDSGLTAFDNLRIATRLGSNPQILFTTTPKRVPSMLQLLKEHKDDPSKIAVTHGSTLDNAGNLSSTYLDAITGIYNGTSIARQELDGLMLDTVEGALWSEEQMLEIHGDMPSYAPLRIIGVDPSVAENPGDECGIVVCGSTADADLYKRQAWVYDDLSVKGSPDVWAKRVAAAAEKWACPVVAEVNQGGALVANAIHQINPNIRVHTVHARNGKQLRAEPVALAYEQNRITHVGVHDALENQMVNWLPGEGKSPDRVDALVHALTALLIKPPEGFVGGRLSAKSFARRTIPNMSAGRGGFGKRGGFRVR